MEGEFPREHVGISWKIEEFLDSNNGIPGNDGWWGETIEMGEVTETGWVLESGVLPNPGRGLGASGRVMERLLCTLICGQHALCTGICTDKQISEL